MFEIAMGIILAVVLLFVVIPGVIGIVLGLALRLRYGRDAGAHYRRIRENLPKSS